MRMQSELGGGIYTLPDIGHILKIPYQKVHRWIKEYWDKRLATNFQTTYSWHDGKSRAIGFHTLIELVVFSQLNEAGIKPKDILFAHSELAKEFNTQYPFATSRVVKNIKTDGLKIYFKRDSENIYSLDGKKQLNLQFISNFFKNIDFGDGDLAARFWPMGKEKRIVVDPSHQLGQPVIKGTNITPESIISMHLAGDSRQLIAHIYDIEEQDVNDAIEFGKLAA